MQVSMTKTTKAKGKPMKQASMEVKKETALAAPSLSEWGKSTMSSKMLLIPKILVMQLTSKMVIDEKAVFGDFISSLTEKKIGSYKQPMEIVPIYLYEMWADFEMVKGKREFRKMLPVTPENDNREYKWKDENGVEFESDRVANLYCLLPSDIANGGELPYLLSFRSTSRIAARKIATQMYAINPGSGISPAGMTMTISGEKKEGKKGAWVQLDAKVSRSSTTQEELAALKWFKTIMAGQTKVTHDDIVEEVKGETPDVTDY